MKPFWSARALLLLLGANGIAADNDGRDKLLGTWVEAGNAAPSSWTFAGKGNAFQITQVEGAKTISEYPCNADGQQCKIKVSGKKAEVSMWFNGPILVQIETEGSTVFKRRFEVVADGDSMQLETTPISPKGKVETVQFKRAPVQR